jgi:uncharacterized protein (TIGR00251 family)
MQADLPPFLRVQSDGVCLQVRVQPRSSRNEIGDIIGTELKIKVTAPPVDSAANEALLRFLADTVGCPRGAVQLVRGQTSRHKILCFRGVSVELLCERLVSKDRDRAP